MSRIRQYTSLTRIAPLSERGLAVQSLARNAWATGDYVVGRVSEPPGGYSQIESRSGRMVEVAAGMEVVGALGVRHATLEVTGTWETMATGDPMHVLTSAGLLGDLTSTSPGMKRLITLEYVGHAFLDGEKATMDRFVDAVPARPFTVPTVLITGTSMSAGKTTAARAIIQQLKAAGVRVLGAKLTGAGRYRDILHMADAGADHVFDFVDVGLPSTVHPEATYIERLDELLSKMAAAEPEVAVVEIGASPLEPYNGAAAIRAIEDSVRCTILAASDPYAVHGVMHAFGMRPDLVTGFAASTDAGIELVERLCDVQALNVMEAAAQPALRRLLAQALALDLSDFAS